MRTAWHQRHLDDALDLVRTRKYRSALDRLTTVLSVYPDDRATLEAAVFVVNAGSRRSSEPDGPTEALGSSELFDARLNGIYCQCEALGCGKIWPTNHFDFPDASRVSITNPRGGRCDSCERTFCRDHALTDFLFACPDCEAQLDATAPPNRSRSLQTERVNKPIAHVAVVAEGPDATSPEFLTELFRAIAPDVLEGPNPPTVSAYGRPRFDGSERDLAMTAAGASHPEYFTSAYDLRVYDGTGADGRRGWVIAKVFEDRPKFVDPDR
jgi:hypothetical protein